MMMFGSFLFCSIVVRCARARMRARRTLLQSRRTLLRRNVAGIGIVADQQAHFEQAIGQLERFVEDKILVSRRERAAEIRNQVRGIPPAAGGILRVLRRSLA